jgi:protein TonB
MLTILLAAALAGQPAPPVRTTPPPPRDGNLSQLVSSEDYPAEARRLKQQGRVGFRLDVSAEGRVTACTITASSGSPILDSTTCTLMQRRARFRPALDREGRPTEDSQDYAVTWVLP